MSCISIAFQKICVQQQGFRVLALFYLCNKFLQRSLTERYEVVRPKLPGGGTI